VAFLSISFLQNNKKDNKMNYLIPFLFLSPNIIYIVAKGVVINHPCRFLK